jgi:hypothetical protein
MDTNYEMANETAIKEVKNLISDGITNLTPDLVNKLRYRFSDDSIVDSIMEHFADRRKKIAKIGKIFIEAFQKKYRNDFYSMSLSKFMKIAIKYKKKYDLSDDEFDEIKRVFEAKIFNTPQALSSASSVIYPNTNLSRVLGYPITESTDAIQPSSSDDYSYLQDILKIHQFFKPIHSYIVIQTMTYQDLSDEATRGLFEPNKHNINHYVHPVLAALFLPKMNSLEERMLYASISNIINTKYSRERIITKPDYELFYSLVVDPSDTVCDNVSPLRDLKNRVDVQSQLWNNVYNLRNGRYYDASVLDFVTQIDKCKISSVDNPDLMYLSDEGIILRRLFAIFAYRPIIVYTQPIFGAIINNPLNLPVNNHAITSIPYITYKLPNVQMTGQVHKLTDSNNMIQFYLENGSFVPKVTTIINVNGPIVFYVPRRALTLPVAISNPQLQPFGIASLAQSTRHYQNINFVPIDFEEQIVLANSGNESSNVKQFYIRSIVTFERMPQSTIILGHFTYLFKYNRNSDGSIIAGTIAELLVYAPRNAISIASNKNAVLTATYADELERISTNGTIFVYSDV